MREDSAPGVMPLAVRYRGLINGRTLEGDGRGRLDLSTKGTHGITVRYERMPDGFHPFAVGATFVTVGIGAARRHGRALNLWDLSGGSYTFRRTVTWPAFPGDEVAVAADVDLRDGAFTLDARYTGRYSGPVGLTDVLLSESVMRRAANPSVVDERGRAVVLTHDGATFEATWTCRYEHLSRPMAVEAQRGSMTPSRLRYADRVLELRWRSDVWEAYSPKAPGANLNGPAAPGLTRPWPEGDRGSRPRPHTTPEVRT